MLIKFSLILILAFFTSCQVKYPYKCLPNRDQYQMCTMEYLPVCGVYNQSVRCIRFPCGFTAGNACSACSNPDVDYVLAGDCEIALSNEAPPKEVKFPYTCQKEDRGRVDCPKILDPVEWKNKNANDKVQRKVVFANYCIACIDPAVDVVKKKKN